MAVSRHSVSPAPNASPLPRCSASALLLLLLLLLLLSAAFYLGHFLLQFRVCALPLARVDGLNAQHLAVHHVHDAVCVVFEALVVCDHDTGDAFMAVQLQ